MKGLGHLFSVDYFYQDISQMWRLNKISVREKFTLGLWRKYLYIDNRNGKLQFVNSAVENQKYIVQ